MREVKNINDQNGENMKKSHRDDHFAPKMLLKKKDVVFIVIVSMLNRTLRYMMFSALMQQRIGHVTRHF